MGNWGFKYRTSLNKTADTTSLVTSWKPEYNHLAEGKQAHGILLHGL